MAITREQKAEIINEFAQGEGDTGSPAVQIALLTARINYLTEHLKQHRKDHASRRGLLMLVARRNKLLRYLRDNDRQRYLEVTARLGLRRRQ